MAKIKLTKTAVESAQPQAKAVELRDTVVPGFLCKITPAGRRVFMLQYRTNADERRKPALGLFGELTVEQARVMAQDWLAEVRRGGDPLQCSDREAFHPGAGAFRVRMTAMTINRQPSLRAAPERPGALGARG
jgi:hypothetical protein